MNAELVPADSMAAMEALDPELRELAVAQMLGEARSWLAHAMKASEPTQIANFKAQMATMAEATRQLGLSQEIQLDAQEMVRRAERSVGLAIRKGQENGTIETDFDRKSRAARMARGTYHNLDKDVVKTSLSDIVHTHDLTNNGAGISHLVDGVSDDQFDEALIEAKEEGNLSRANVIRKAKGVASRLTGTKRLEKIEELAKRGMSSDQIGKELGYAEKTIRKFAREADVDIPADRLMSKTSRHIDHDRIAQQTVSALEGLTMGVELFNPARVTDKKHLNDWVTSLTNSLRLLNQFHKHLKEMTQ